jgi:hypothetical protein
MKLTFWKNLFLDDWTFEMTQEPFGQTERPGLATSRSHTNYSVHPTQPASQLLDSGLWIRLHMEISLQIHGNNLISISV